jgi:hypothetical protein
MKEERDREWRSGGEKERVKIEGVVKEERRSEGEMNGREGMECLQRYVPTS